MMKDLTAKQTAKKLEHFVKEKQLCIFVEKNTRMYAHTFDEVGVVVDKRILIVSLYGSLCKITKEYKTFREALTEAIELMKEF